ncbi:unnamed protein product [Mytilus coruscus]|uniref:Integrase SAM-like N-terminal domain-containing protein n=1 Tax=Mytilus coruscus TaxID=42192 RepID=A0A6J8E3C5_MYTCO|nr:unnamed protein product [Mytilus coruscus]
MSRDNIIGEEIIINHCMSRDNSIGEETIMNHCMSRDNSVGEETIINHCMSTDNSVGEETIMNHYGTDLLSDLEIAVEQIKGKGWADSTYGTYHTHLKTYVKFCEDYKLKPVTCDQQTVKIYIAYLFDKKHFAYSSFRSYINIISILHKMHDLKDPVADSWNIKHLLTGVKRELGTSQSCKAPVTPELLNVRKCLDMSNHNNAVFGPLV